jgi:hypothetical protein
MPDNPYQQVETTMEGAIELLSRQVVDSQKYIERLKTEIDSLRMMLSFVTTLVRNYGVITPTEYNEELEKYGAIIQESGASPELKERAAADISLFGASVRAPVRLGVIEGGKARDLSAAGPADASQITPLEPLA